MISTKHVDLHTFMVLDENGRFLLLQMMSRQNVLFLQCLHFVHVLSHQYRLRRQEGIGGRQAIGHISVHRIGKAVSECLTV